MARKTIDVTDVVMFANVALAHTVPTADEDHATGVARRWGIIGMVESVLLTSDNYRGFSYLPSELAEPGVLRDGYDPTRRCYS